MNDAQVKQMVDRFLGWKLPRDTFNPDCGISFDKAPFNVHTGHPMLHEPTGTNLFDAQQATAMVRHMVEGLVSDESMRHVIARAIQAADGSRNIPSRYALDVPDDISEWGIWLADAVVGALIGNGYTISK